MIYIYAYDYDISHDDFIRNAKYIYRKEILIVFSKNNLNFGSFLCTCLSFIRF